MNRRDFVRSGALGAAVLIAPGALFAQEMKDKPKVEKPPALDPDLVKSFVGAAHADFAKTQELLKQEPNLLYSMWDWGGGDFETGLEGAGHVGSKEIAKFLIAQGARPNIFVLTMLGQTEIVKAVLETYPELLNSKGPHGYTLLHHAEKGEGDAEELLKYLTDKGLKEKRVMLY